MSPASPPPGTCPPICRPVLSVLLFVSLTVMVKRFPFALGCGRWRVYDMVTVPAEGGSVKLVRRAVVAEGVVRPGAA